jgi:hypothetical protein
MNTPHMIASSGMTRCVGLALGLGLGLAIAASNACSLALDWDPNGQPCEDKAPLCNAGYSCLGEQCIKDRSVSLGGTCTNDLQCEGNSICTPRPKFLCRSQCSSYLTPTTECASGSYCRPSPNLENSDPRGSCVASECDPAAPPCPAGTVCPGTCATGTVCVGISPGAGACLPECKVSLQSDYSANDNCVSVSSARITQICQPIGLEGKRRLICIERSVSPQNNGMTCNFGTTTCGKGLACVDGSCRKYCDTVTGYPCCDPADTTKQCPDKCRKTDLADGKFVGTCAP